MKNSYLEQLKNELDAYTVQCGNTRPESVLETLWHCYFTANSIDDGQIRRCEAALEPVYRELSVTGEDTLFDLIDDLVTAYQRSVFLEGMQTGPQLIRMLE